MVDKKSILDFLKKNELCVLATASKTGKPAVAVMVYVILNLQNHCCLWSKDTKFSPKENWWVKFTQQFS